MHYIVIILILLLSFIWEFKAVEDCGSKQCINGICQNFAYEVCNCSDKYATVPEDNLQNCNYQKKSQLLAFVLESFVTFGAGHFYIEDFKVGFLKLFVWVLACFIFISIRFIANKENANSSSGVMIAFFGCFFCYVMVLWQIVDMVLFGINKIKDGNNIELVSWSK
jgi:hypothetical protein